jgi:hypothetical protein
LQGDEFIKSLITQFYQKKKESDHSNACCFDCMDTLYMLCM